MSKTQVLIVEKSDGVLTLRLNRPDARNALDIELTRALAAQLLEFEADPEVSVLVVTGSDPAFCAGLDLKDFSAPTSPRSEVAAMIDMWPRLTKPVIAAVNGPAYTGALEIALACDFIVASERAKFADTHTKIGALAGGGMTARLPNAVGMRWAKQMSFSGIPVDAQTALRIGLVNEVKLHDQLLPYVHELAKAIAVHDPELLTTVKRTIDCGALSTMAEGLYREREALNGRKARGSMTWKP